MSLAAGIMAAKNIHLAVIFTRLLYCFWFVHCFSLSVAVAFCGYRLTRILSAHLKKFNTSGPRYVSVQTGIFKIRAIMGITLVCLMSFAVFLLCWGILRDLIMVNMYGSIVLGAIWNSLGAACTFLVVCAVLFNPKIDEPTGLGLKSSSAEKSSQAAQFVTYSNFSTQEYSAAASNPNGAQGTLSHNAFDELKLQQLQYQKVFQKHNQHQLPHNTSNRSQGNNMNDLPTAESRQVKLSAAGIPIDDSEFYNDRRYNNEKNLPFSNSHHQQHHLDDERTLDDGADSQLDLVEYASKN